MEEKNLIKYEEKKGPLSWIRNQFRKLKEKFTSVRVSSDEGELTEEQMEAVEGGYPNIDVIDFDERKAKIESLEPKKKEESKSWELTEQELDDIKAGYPGIIKEHMENEESKKEATSNELSEKNAGFEIND